MEKQIKAAYPELHAPEALIRAVLLRVNAAQTKKETEPKKAAKGHPAVQ